MAKVSLDAGLTCPNRDGTLSGQGCLFCEADGSGTGAARRGLSLEAQIETGLYKSSSRADRFIAYFQAFTNTYAPAVELKRMWDLALSYEPMIGLAVGTRPDCLSDDVLDLLAGYAETREVWLELGLQSASDVTLTLINRGHTVDDFTRGARRAKARGLKVLAHVILGLPGEGQPETLATARFITALNLDGVKIHSLYISEVTGLARMYHQGEYQPLTREAFVRLAVLFLENLSPGMVVHRLTGDPNPNTLIAPRWCLEKQATLEMIRRRLESLDTWQGRGLGAPRPDCGETLEERGVFP